MKGLPRKTIVVAGGASGIGAETCRRLAEEGSRVVVGDINMDGARSVVAEITGASGSAVAVECDISDESACRELAEVAVREYGGIDGLFNVAGNFREEVRHNDIDALNVPLEIWNETMAVNLAGYLLTTRAVLPSLLERGGGAIVNTLSGLAFYGDTRGPAYTASKSALVAFTRHVAKKWGPLGVRCNGIAPGLVLTETALASWSDEERAKFISLTTTPRPGRPSDIASMASFLLSDDAEWINGQMHMVTGGRW